MSQVTGKEDSYPDLDHRVEIKGDQLAGDSWYGEEEVKDPYDVQPVRVLYRTENGGKAPEYGTETAAGCDIFATEDVTLYPPTVVGVKEEINKYGEMQHVDTSIHDEDAFRYEVRNQPVIISTGLFVAMPPGVEMHIRDRSGLGFNYDILPFNGTIDSDYRGEIKVKIWNDGSKPYKIEKGHRIAQAVFTHILRAEFEEVTELPPSGRMDGGLGHTGK